MPYTARNGSTWSTSISQFPPRVRGLPRSRRTEIAATADGSTVLVNQSDTDTDAIIDLDDPAARQSVTVGARPGGAIAAPDSTTAYITNGAAASISVLNTADAGCTGIACIPTGSFGG